MGKRADVGDRRERKSGLFEKVSAPSKWKKVTDKEALKKWAENKNSEGSDSKSLQNWAQKKAEKAQAPKSEKSEITKPETKSEPKSPIAIPTRGDPFQEMSPEEQKTALAMSQFSNDVHYGALRDPSKPEVTSSFELKLGGKYVGTHNPPPADEVRDRLSQLANQPYKGILYRGMSVQPDALAGLKKGNTFEFGKFASFTGDKGVATEFARSREGRDVKVLIRVTAKRGTDIAHYSRYPEEREVISGGSAKITGIRKSGDVVMIDMEQT